MNNMIIKQTKKATWHNLKMHIPLGEGFPLAENVKAYSFILALETSSISDK